ncbi:hypothetical protein DFQ05_1769 [Winogradskyella wandonensis]|uniref:Uncharacterized protein n=1 Tax=Winogradskyella wandonensis TaxID=1442586 RepID=A0A4R1KSF5_9FLAO|nr:hypothetical protein [Winogradskyella wandonensis]TCK67985.1 hypothetical protein DFQ05_1769 [Winogradskyella wandonensis]
MKTLFATLCLVFFVSISFAQEEKYQYLESVKVGNTVYQLNYLSKDNSFIIQIKLADTTGKTDEYGWDVDKSVLAQGIVQTMNATFSEDYIYDNLGNQQNGLLAIKEKVLQRKRDALQEEQRILNDIDNAEDQYSGRLSLNETAVIRKINAHKNCKEGSDIQVVKSSLDGSQTIKLNRALVQFFNNKASSIYVEATYKNERLIFVNNSFSVPLRWFNNYGMRVSATTSNCQEIWIDYNDVFDFQSDQFFNYSIANDQVELSTETKEKSSQPVVQRRFFDFFTGVIYSDVLGLNSSNSNSVLNAQATLLVPMNTRNWGEWTATRQFIASVSVALNNSFEDDTRFMGFQNNENVNEFDLYTKRNINADIYLDLISYESKGWFLNTSLGYKGSYYRTGYRFTDVTDNLDNVTEGQVFTTGHGPYLNFEFRPQNNFGADVNFNYEFFEFSDQILLGETDFEDMVLNQKGDLLHVKANFYWLTNPKNSDGGIYASLGMTYHTGTDGVFPQLMVGYATNLTSFVNRFRSNNTPKEAAD